ncbi:MMPL family transporter, partial [Myxococcota bacterium]|nr:MMPL family transporter [Myxococcota bacterium]
MITTLFHRFLRLVFRYPLRLLGLFILLTALGFFGATRLSLSTSLSKLLPKNTPSVKTGNEVGLRVGSTDFLVVAIESPDPLLNKRVADAVALRLKRDMPELNEVMAKVDLEFFKDNGLLWFSEERLAAIDAQLKKVLGRAKLENMGLLVLPEGKDPEETKLDDMIRESTLPAEIPTELKSNRKRPEALKGYLSSPDGKILAVVGRPGRVAVNMRYARRLVIAATKIITEVKKEFPQKDLKIEVGGGYRNRVREYDSILRDMVSSFGLSLGLIALLVILFFRSLRPLPLIFLPLISGLLVTLGITRLMGLAQLNIITAFIGGILLGMGIDFGVHLTARYLEERGKGAALEEALTTTMVSTGRALITAAVTTAAALYLLFFSSFRGFWEFGLIAGTGVLVTLMFFLVFFPVMAVLLERVFAVRGSGFVPFTPKKDKGRFPRVSLALFSLGIIATVLLAVIGLPRLEFESNFRRLSSGKPSTSIKYGKAMGDNASPTVALCKTTRDCALFDDYLKKLLNKPLPDPDLRDYLA